MWCKGSARLHRYCSHLINHGMVYGLVGGVYGYWVVKTIRKLVSLIRISLNSVSTKVVHGV